MGRGALAELGQILGAGDEVVVVAALSTPASRRLEVARCWRWPENVWMGVPLETQRWLAVLPVSRV